VKICALIPTYNHHTVLAEVVAKARSFDLCVFIIDDGSNAQTRQVVANLHDPDHGVFCHRLPRNGGKGVAVMTGMELAHQAGFTHAIQIDADGQHDLDRILLMLALPHHESLS